MGQRLERAAELGPAGPRPATSSGSASRSRASTTGGPPFFDDTEAEFDYRYVSWGGVQIDDRSVAAARAGILCLTCIPALHHPAVTDASTGRWYPDQAIVFGVVINGEARAYPKHIMEAHEMVTDTLGGRVFGMPYCTLLRLRSGLLRR